MKRYMVCAGLDESFGVAVGVGYHKVTVKNKLAAIAELGDDGRADSDIRDKMAIHYIEVDYLNTGRGNLCYLVT
jgi:hypothetical protein